jgi:hypothetical protein
MPCERRPTAVVGGCLLVVLAGFVFAVCGLVRQAPATITLGASVTAVGGAAMLAARRRVR